MSLVDEAYSHYADSPPYESVIPLVADHPNLMVTRTFSKIYGIVRVGRLSALPNHMRVAIGRKSEMEVFLSAFHQVTA